MIDLFWKGHNEGEKGDTQPDPGGIRNGMGHRHQKEFCIFQAKKNPELGKQKNASFYFFHVIKCRVKYERGDPVTACSR